MQLNAREMNLNTLPKPDEAAQRQLNAAHRAVQVGESSSMLEKCSFKSTKSSESS
jgi:hypothetical protein